MSKPLKMAICHPELPNYYFGKCEKCYEWIRDPSAPCPHPERIKDWRGRCSSCMSRLYYLRRNSGIGDKFGTPRTTEARLKLGVSATTPEEFNRLVTRKRRLRPYNLSLEDYDKMFETQDGRCAICRETSKKDLNVDHDHKCCPPKMSCGKCIRGLLCHGCNMRLGQLESDLVTKSLEYLNRYERL